MIDQKVKTAIERLKMFEPEEGYFVAFSGGKDSQCVYHLCEMAGVKFDAHYNVASVDPPELIRFMREHYPTVSHEIPHDKDGKPVTMWNLIPKKLMPPTRRARYCCEHLKEKAGVGRVTVTGVRWAESRNRAANQGGITIPKATKALKKSLEDSGLNFLSTAKGVVVMNTDNDDSRRMVEQCYRTHKTLINPIIDWSEDDVWAFLKDVRQVPSCELYGEGWHRLGCIGCPMAGASRFKELQRWPKYKKLYLHAFDRMLAERAKRAKRAKPNDWRTAEEVFDWWMGRDVLPGQMRMDEFVKEDEG